MLVWAALPFSKEFLEPIFKAGNIIFPRGCFTQFYKVIDEAICRGKESCPSTSFWVAQVEINEEDLLTALNDFSFYLATEEANHRLADQMPQGIRATIKKVLLCEK